MAEGLLREMAKQRGLDIQTDSAGTGNSHLGQAPDPRAQAEMRKHGMDISDLRARLFTRADFERFDLLLAMDRDNLDTLRERCPPEAQDRLHLLMPFAQSAPTDEVPDPYYGAVSGFDLALDLIEPACDGLLQELRRRLQATA